MHARAMEEHTWMAWSLMEAPFVSETPTLGVLIALNSHLIVS